MATSTALVNITTIRLKDEFSTTDFYVGLSLALSSTIFIGASFIIKKKGLLRLSRHGSIRAGSGGYGYLREWIWWAGLISMGVGEAANFAAYAFAPATLVTPLGALSILVSAVLSAKFLNEHLNILGKIGCFLCVLGSTIIVLHSPKEGNLASMDELQIRLQNAGFLTYALFSIFISVILIFYIGPKYGQSNIVVYISICSLLGSLSVMACKGVGIALKSTFSGVKNELNNWLTWFCLFSLIITITVQMNYLNKALDIFNTSAVSPVNYVFFTTFVIIASATLFNEWNHMSGENILGILCGFLTIVVAVFLIHSFKDLSISLSTLQLNFHHEIENGIEDCDVTTTLLGHNGVNHHSSDDITSSLSRSYTSEKKLGNHSAIS